MINGLKNGDRYQHYKGKHYTIIGFGRNAENCELCVYYEGNYFDEEFGQNPRWFRPVAEFTGTVIVHGKEVSRFKKLII